jgi:hypothetical protein
LTLDTATGAITGTLTTAGVFSGTLRATNATGTGTAPLEITAQIPAPVLTGTLKASGIVGTPFVYQITARNAPTSYAATGLAPGLTLDTATGAISGTLATVGVFTGTLVESAASGVGTPTQQLLDGVTVADLDLSSTNGLVSSVFGAGTITVTLASRQAGDQFTLAGSLGSSAGVASTSGGTAANGDYVVTLTSGATVAQAQTILQAIRYEYTGDEPPTTTRNYTVVLSDGNNQDAGGDTAGGPSALAAGTITG